MTLVVLGIDALDPELVDREDHPNLTLESHRAIETIVSSAGEPSTHELWPTIITGLEPEEHGLVLDDGVAWENPVLRAGSRMGNFVLPDRVQTAVGNWLLTNTNADAFRTSASYYEDHGISTVFDGRESKAIGIPNYVVDPDSEDREHQLRRNMGDLFERTSDAKGGHKSSNPVEFYERCMEMSMIRIARVRRALRSRQYELVFGYTSGLDLIGHVSYDRQNLREGSYDEIDEFVGELRDDLGEDDELLIISDHGLQDGLHTDKAMVSATNPNIISSITSVLDVRTAIDGELDRGSHELVDHSKVDTRDTAQSKAVKEQLQELGYL